MLLENLDLGVMYDVINVKRRIHYDVIEPIEYSLFPARVIRRDVNSKKYNARLFIPEKPSDYVIELEHIIEERNELLVKQLKIKYGEFKFEERKNEPTNIVLYYLIEEALQNAYLRGKQYHKKNTDEIRIKLTIDEGTDGHIITISDSTGGFDFNKLENSQRGIARDFSRTTRFVNNYSEPGIDFHILYKDVQTWEPQGKPHIYMGRKAPFARSAYNPYRMAL